MAPEHECDLGDICPGECEEGQGRDCGRPIRWILSGGPTYHVCDAHLLGVLADLDYLERLVLQPVH